MGKLKNILKNFLEHYEDLNRSHCRKLKALDESKENGRHSPPPLSMYEQEYLKLKELTELLKTDPNYPMAEGVSDVNRKKNRYKDILPYDNSRVILSEYPGVPGSDYINANYVRGSSGNQRAYIASQGPLPNTLVDYWRMIWETEVLVIVMVCNEREAGKYKCEPYWPTAPEELQQYGNITVEHVKWRQVCPDFLVRTFRVTAENEERTICQFHYTTWPDHGVPVSVNPILELVRLMRDVQSTESRPILVHCSAGCGRTGTLCSIDYVWALLRTGKLRETFSLFEIICDMRRQRTSMVQTLEQYILCYKAVATLFEQHLKLIDAHTYENIDLNGEPIEDGPTQCTPQQTSTKVQTTTTTTTTATNRKNKPLPEIVDISSDSCSPRLSFHEAPKHEQNVNKQQQQQQQKQPPPPPPPIESRRPPPDKPKSEDVEICSIDVNQNQSETDASDDDNPHDDSEEIRTEPKRIGKATVIRRPSIAKLKAIFDSPSAANLSNTFDVSREPEAEEQRPSRLRRSQSIKDNIRNLNFNIQLEINQSRKSPPSHRKSKSYTLNSAKLSVYKKHLSIGDLELEDNTTVKVNADLGDSGGETTGTSSRNESSQNSEQISSPATVPESLSTHQNPPQLNAETPTPQEYKNGAHLLRPVPVKLTSQPFPGHFSRAEELIPPKPPRTYQHVLDDSCILRTPEGRLIVAMGHHGSASRHLQSAMDSNLMPMHQYQQKSKSIYDLSTTHKYSVPPTPNMMMAPQEHSFGPAMRPTPQHFMHQQQQQPKIFPALPPKKQYSMPGMLPPPTHITASSRTPLPEGFAYTQDGQHRFGPVRDMFGQQHFQYHQAKPIAVMSQQNYFEPIYGQTAIPFMTQAPHQMMYRMQPRPRSVSHGQFKQINYENIYSNREMCFGLPQVPQQLLQRQIQPQMQAQMQSQMQPQMQRPPENIYAEISTLPMSQKAPISNEQQQQQQQLNQQQASQALPANDRQTGSNKDAPSGKTSSEENPAKSKSFSKLRNVFKAFGLSSKVSPSESKKKDAPNPGQDGAQNSNTSFTQMNNHSSTGSAVGKQLPSTQNGTPINPLNGQPLNRPPHSHRFQQSQQWTQV